MGQLTCGFSLLVKWKALTWTAFCEGNSRFKPSSLPPYSLGWPLSEGKLLRLFSEVLRISVAYLQLTLILNLVKRGQFLLKYDFHVFPRMIPKHLLGSSFDTGKWTCQGIKTRCAILFKTCSTIKSLCYKLIDSTLCTYWVLFLCWLFEVLPIITLK